MTTLLTWMSKRVVRSRLQSWSDMAGNALSGIEVEYALPPEPDRVCVYLGRARTVRAQATAEHGLVFREDTTVDVRVRVQQPGGDIESAETQAETICQAIAAAVTAEPRISLGTVAVTATDQDPTTVAPDPDSYVTVNVLLSVTLSMLVPGS